MHLLDYGSYLNWTLQYAKSFPNPPIENQVKNHASENELRTTRNMGNQQLWYLPTTRQQMRSKMVDAHTQGSERFKATQTWTENPALLPSL